MIRVGTRGSALAVAQAAEVASRLRHAHQYLTHHDIELIPIRTTGDRIQDRPLAAIGGKGLFVREIERALLAGEIDLAVHSMKDLEPELAPGTTIAAILPRADPHDCLVPPGRYRETRLGHARGHQFSAPASNPEACPAGPHYRSGSRECRHSSRAPRSRSGGCARARGGGPGAARLPFGVQSNPGRHDVPRGWPGGDRRPDPSGRRALSPLVECIKDAPTTAEVSAERAFVASLSATCQTPVGAYAKVSRDVIQLTTVILSLDGTRVKWASREGPTDRPDEIGHRLGAEQVEAIEREHGGGAAFFGYGVHDGIAAPPGSTG